MLTPKVNPGFTANGNIFSSSFAYITSLRPISLTLVFIIPSELSSKQKSQKMLMQLTSFELTILARGKFRIHELDAFNLLFYRCFVVRFHFFLKTINRKRGVNLDVVFCFVGARSRQLKFVRWQLLFLNVRTPNFLKLFLVRK